MEKNYRYKYCSSKKANQAINRFHYYMENIIPLYFPQESKSYINEAGILKSAMGENNLIYFWGRQYVEGESYVNQQSILRSIESTHLEKGHNDEEILKINQSSFQKITKPPESFYGLVTSGWTVSEVLQFVLKAGQNQKGKKPTYELYIIHHCQNITSQTNNKFLKWLYYVEKYSFLEEGILYQTVGVINRETSYFGYYSNQGIFENLMKKYYKFNKFQGYLLQYQQNIRQKIKQSQDPAFNEQHRLCKHIPVQFLKMLETLKKEFGSDKQQLICRYMIARQYKLQQIRKSLKQYLQFYEEYSKYKWQDFEEFHKMNIFYYIGQDYKGRPVILNKAKNVLVDKIDPDRYCRYYMWYLEIYLPTKMRGYVTQLNIIADVEDIGQVNFKFAITKRNVEDGKKYCVERQYKFFAVNISAFAHFAYKFIKPLLPKKTQQKVYIGGNNIKEIFENLNKDMSENVIPTYLGGKNPLL